MPSVIRVGRVRVGDSPKLVATVTAPHMPAQLARARADGADLIELRLDYLAHWPEDRIVKTVEAAAKATPLPLIATIRTPREGGARRDGVVAEEKRREALFKAVLPHVAAIDVELSSPILGEIVAAARRAAVPTIVSYHHFSSTPSLSRLRALAQLAKAKGGDIVKIVTMTASPVEMLRLLSLLHEKPSQPLAAFAMGRQALLSRLMAQFFRSALLYGAVPAPAGFAPPAPGVPALADLKDGLRRLGLT